MCLATALALAGDAAAQASKPAKPIPLRKDGRADERPMKGGDAQTYGIGLKTGDYCVIALTQSAVDLVATMTGPDGVTIADVDSPRRTTGDEVVEIVATKSGAHHVTARVVVPDAEPGSARIRVVEVRRATDADRRRVAALRVLERAEQARGEGTAASIETAKTAYEDAILRFRANGDRREIARSLLGLAKTMSTRAGPTYREAAGAFRDAGDPAGEAEALAATEAEEDVAAALNLLPRQSDRTVEALVLRNQAGMVFWQRNYKESQAIAARSAAAFKDLHDDWGYGRARRTYAMTVQELGNPRAALSEFEEVLELAERRQDWELQSLALGSLAYAWVYIGDRDRAFECYTRAIEIARRAGSRGTEGWQLIGLGQLHSARGQPEQALTVYFRGLELLREAGIEMDEGVALGAIGQAYSALGEREKGLTYRKQALEIFQRIGDKQEEAVQLLNLGAEYDRLGNGDEAELYLSRSLDLARQLKDRRRAAWTLRSLANGYAGRGDYHQSLTVLGQAIEMGQGIDDAVAKIRAQILLADLHRILGEYDRALAAYRQAFDAAGEGGLTLEQVAIDIRLGHTFSDQAKFDLANQRYSAALARLRDGTRTVPAGEAAALEGLGATRRATGDNVGSIAAFEESLAISRRIQDRGHEIGSLNGLAQTLVATGDLDRALGMLAEALRLSREGRLPGSEGVVLRSLMTAWRAAGRPPLAVFYGKAAVNQFQTVRLNIAQLDPQTQRAYLRSKEEVYRELADLLISQGRLPEAQQVLGFLKEGEFREYIRGGGSAAVTKLVELTPEEAAAEQRYREIEGQLVALARRQSLLTAKRSRSGPEESELTQIASDLKLAAQRYQAFLDSLATEFAASGEGSARTFQLREAQGLMGTLRDLGPGTVALYTIVGPERYSVILVTPEIQKAATYPMGAADLSRKVLAFREVLQNPASDPRPLAQELYKILVGPIARDLEQAQARTLMWSLDGVLRYVPFSALHDGRGYLVERYRSSVFTPAGDSHLKDAAGSWRSGLGVGVSKAQPGFDPLPDVAGELRGIIKDPSGNGDGVLRGRVLLDEAFTESALRAELGQEPPVVHVASHFQFRPGNEADSFLLLGDGRRLSVGELRTSWNFFKGVDLLTLSACDTAVGGAGATGKEVESFSVFAQRNGAKSVVATLWPVADTSTRVLMERFYRARMQSKGTSKAEALQTAQLALLRGDDPSSGSAGTRARRAKAAAQSASGESTSRYQHPFYWAPFLLIGNWR